VSFFLICVLSLFFFYVFCLPFGRQVALSLSLQLLGLMLGLGLGLMLGLRLGLGLAAMVRGAYQAYQEY
jgi:uncharacterized membrane protein